MKSKIYVLLALLLMLCAIVGSAKKVHTLGDSTMASYNENATNTRGWGMYFGNFLTNGWTSINYAKGGRDSRAGYKELWNNAKDNVEAGDYVLIQFAHNDEKYNGVDNLELQAYYAAKGDATNATAVKSDGRGTTPSTTYKECLKQIVDAVKEKGATPVLVSAVCRCYFGSDNKITRSGRHDLGDKFDAIIDGQLKTGQKIAASDHTMDYGYQMQQLATELNVAFIDMTSATKELYERYGSYDNCYAALFDKGSEKDNTHYNLTGALTAARHCAQLMKEKGILADDIVIPTELSIAPATVDMGEGYMGKTAMKELTLSGLGLDMLSADKQNWQNALEVNYQNGSLIKTFYARVSLAAVGKFNGTITATQGTKSIEVPVTVNVIELGGGEPFSVSWPMVPNDEATVTGNVVAAAAKLEGLGKYGNVNGFGALIAPDGKTGEGKKLDINSLAMKIKAQGGGALQCHVYYSTDGFVTRKTIFSSAVLTSTWNEISSDDVIKVDEGDKLLIRVYPWSKNVDNGRWICVSDVTIGGQVKDAAGVNVTGSITYTLDKGGLTQGDDVVFSPETLSAGFAAKKWSAGSALTVDGTIQYVGQNNDKTNQTKVYNGTAGSLSSSRVDDNALKLTLTPEDGFTFVPSKVSFKAARYGTDGGNIGAAVKAGDEEVVLVENAAVNRGGKNLDIASFSEPVDGITATADKPMELSFYFLGLGKTKSMGISDVVIEGQLVGAAAQVTKYTLNTQVVPSVEAGNISREPDMEQFKEGTVVTLKATKNFGYRFKEWQDAKGVVISSEPTVTVTMDSEKTVKAVFESVPVYKVTTKVTNDAERQMGSVVLSPNEHDGQYEAGTKIVATANESKILKFLSWTDANENANALKERELTVNGDMELVANYEVQDFIAVPQPAILLLPMKHGTLSVMPRAVW
ncbi:SGNH/GDSL hydrolase family protein [uncultured Prevotella sp.]|uniref:SGNH/GDSL hydrolase family protein n=1 Tax=uncultured Prevotella sp. TaxID=159272 RepID=UPI0025841EFB|nr:SGNH/GDSL hydrolase family protein [uncultured Prevotella sp.]